MLLADFEAQHLWFSRASLSVSRSVRVAQMLGLHKVDASSMSSITLAPPSNWRDKEERRRTMWAIFCADRLSSSTTGNPVLLESRRVRLPRSLDTRIVYCVYKSNHRARFKRYFPPRTNASSLASKRNQLLYKKLLATNQPNIPHSLVEFYRHIFSMTV